MTLPPPTTTSSVDKACHVIRDAIHNGQYPGGSWIREIAVAQVAEVSRTSVRQALNVLAAEGYVELHPNASRHGPPRSVPTSESTMRTWAPDG